MNERIEAICHALWYAKTHPDPPPSYVPLAAALWPACNAVYSLLGKTVQAGTSARTSDAHGILTGLIVHDSVTGKESVFELLHQDAPRASELTDSFCNRLHVRSRIQCKMVIEAHLQATGHLTKPSRVGHLS
jgi:hypothetical protein